MRSGYTRSGKLSLYHLGSFPADVLNNSVASHDFTWLGVLQASTNARCCGGLMQNDDTEFLVGGHFQPLSRFGMEMEYGRVFLVRPNNDCIPRPINLNPE